MRSLEREREDEIQKGANGDAGKEKAAEKRLPEVEDGEEYGDANASEEELEEGKGFFACYLLTSLCPRHKGRTYIGFTVNPRRRIRQHNGEIRCGASRTKRGRPWEMTLCIYGFPSNVSALQLQQTTHVNGQKGLVHGEMHSEEEDLSDEGCNYYPDGMFIEHHNQEWFWN